MKDNGSRCKLTIDGMDMFIKEQRPFSPKWWSHKSNGPGLRYEIGICIQTGWICWFNGPFPCGSFNYSQISMEALIYCLRRGEKVQADTTYETPDKGRRGRRTKGWSQRHVRDTRQSTGVWRCLVVCQTDGDTNWKSIWSSSQYSPGADREGGDNLWSGVQRQAHTTEWA